MNFCILNFKMKTYKIYLKVFSFVSLILLLIVFFINYNVDPENIYKSYLEINKSKKTLSNTYIDKLAISKKGLFFRNDLLNEREIKLSLVKKEGAVECAVLGSSPALQVSSFREIKSFSSTCSSLMNLAFSAAVLEDYLIFSHQLSLSNSPPSKIIIFVYPYTLNLNRDAQWLRYEDDYNKIKDKILINKKNYGEKIPKKNYNNLLFENLFNMKYFLESLKTFFSNNNLPIQEVKKLDYINGMKNNVLLPDGSLVYSSEIMSSKLMRKIDGVSGIQNYKIKENNWYSPYAINIFDKLIKFLSQKFEVILVMSPYHPSVFDFPDQKVVKAINIIEPIIIDIAKKNNVSLYGSFNSKKIPCSKSEYFDAVHARSSCFKKIENLRIIKKK